MIPERGYSTRIVSLNRASSATNPGVKLGRYCIANNIPVTQIAEHFGVSRQTIYNWFAGVHAPSKDTCELIKDYLDRAKA
jgi:transcriptional regulator with XRE-family HTH domain